MSQIGDKVCRRCRFSGAGFVICLTLALASSVEGQTSYTFSTFVGEASIGNIDGIGSEVRFFNPSGVALDDAGNLFVADWRNHTIRKMSATGRVTTIAGKPGMSGSADGNLSNALFSYPYGVAGANDGNLYVADRGNHTVRKITPAGIVSTFAGQAGKAGNADGAGPSAAFNAPTGVVADVAGNVYVADMGNRAIRKISPDGVVTTFAGNVGTPNGVAMDGSGNLYVADWGSQTIRKITISGVVNTLAGSAGSTGSADGEGSNARFNFPCGVVVDKFGNAYVADSNNNTIRKISPEGVVSTFAGQAGREGGNDGTGNGATFRGPNAVAEDGAGNIYVADTYNNTMRKISPTGAVTTVAGRSQSGGSADGSGIKASFSSPNALAVDGVGNVYVADTGNSTIRKITPTGVVSTLAGQAGIRGSDDGPRGDALFFNPCGVAADGVGNVYVADTGNDTIRKISFDGTVSTLAGQAGAAGNADAARTRARFNRPVDVSLDNEANLYVADMGNGTIRKISPAGVVTTLAGLGGNGVAVDGIGNVYASGNQTVSKMTPGGALITLAGLVGNSGSVDGTGNTARFSQPRGVAVDGLGNVFVADMSNTTIRKISPAGVVTTIAGQAGIAGSADGVGTIARFNYPNGVAVDNAGNIYVADTGNNTIRKGVPSTVGAGTSPKFNGIIRMANGTSRISLEGLAGKDVTIHASTNLINWLPLLTFPNPQGTVQFDDPPAANLKQRFYRAVAQ